jgi:hypothetical protein
MATEGEGAESGPPPRFVAPEAAGLERDKPKSGATKQKSGPKVVLSRKSRRPGARRRPKSTKTGLDDDRFSYFVFL